MRTLWNIISFLAVVHLLALLFFIGWLWQSHRLTADRLHETRELFAKTVSEAQSDAAKAAADAEAQRLKDAEAERQAHPPLDSAAQVQYVSLIRQQEEQARRRLDGEKKVLLRQLAQTTDQMNQKQAELDRQRRAWEDATKADQQRKTDEQFMQTVKQYEQLPPKQGKKMLMELVNQKRMDQAVAYLRTMNARAAAKILKEFKTDSEIALATELLEQMRTYGKPEAAADAGGASARAQGPADHGTANAIPRASAPDSSGPGRS